MMKDIEILKKLEESATIMLNAINIPMSYNRHVLRLAEIKLLELFPNENSMRGPGAIPFGILLGNTIINNIPNAKWDLTEFNKEESFFMLNVVIPNVINKDSRNIVYPLKNVINYIKDNERRLTTIYDTVLFNATHSIDDIKALDKDDEGWIYFKNGNCFRITEYLNKK